MQFNKFILLLAIISPLFSFSQKAPSIIPKPNSIVLNNGMFTIDKNTGIQFADKTLKPTAVYLSDCIKHISGISLTQNAGAKKLIAFVIPKENISIAKIIMTALAMANFIFFILLFHLLFLVHHEDARYYPIMF